MVKKPSRIIDGKRYYRMPKTYAKKAEANAEAKRMRARGDHIRVLAYSQKIGPVFAVGAPYRYRLYKR